MNANDILSNIEIIASSLGVTPTKLQAIYLRGVRECVFEGYTDHPAYIYGLVRVQRFAKAVEQSDAELTTDSDLLPSDSEENSKNLPRQGTIADLVSRGPSSFLPGVKNVLAYEINTDTNMLTATTETGEVCIDLLSGETSTVLFDI